MFLKTFEKLSEKWLWIFLIQEEESLPATSEEEIAESGEGNKGNESNKDSDSNEGGEEVDDTEDNEIDAGEEESNHKPGKVPSRKQAEKRWLEITF